MMGVPPSQGWGTPRDRAADGVLDTPRSVCLLRSRRRTFLFYLFLMDSGPKHHFIELTQEFTWIRYG